MDISGINKIKSEIKIELIKYFDEIKFEIDIKTQEILGELDNVLNEKVTNFKEDQIETNLSDEFKAINCDLNRAKRNEILDMNKHFVEKVESLLDENLKMIDKYFTENTLDSSAQLDKENIKKICVRDYCFFIRKDQLNFLFKQLPNPIGLFLVTDFYMNQDQLNYLIQAIKVLTKEEKNQIVTNLDQEYLTLKYSFQALFPNSVLSNKIVTENGQFKLQKNDGIAKKKAQTILAFYHHNIASIKMNAFVEMSNLVSLRLYKLKIEFINAGAFSGLTKLLILDLSYNKIRKIDDNAFENLNQLKKLYLNNNNLTMIHKMMFNGLNELTDLSLNENQIEIIENCSFEKMPSLHKISMPHIRTIEKEVFNGLLSLDTLDLNMSSVENVTDFAFSYFTSLHELTLSMPLIKAITLNFFNGLLNLKKLIITSSNICKIDDNSFQSLTNLLELSIHVSSLKNLNKKTFEGLKSLSQLEMYGLNHLAHIDYLTFKPLVSLKGLKLVGIETTDLFEKLSKTTQNELENEFAGLKNVEVSLY